MVGLQLQSKVDFSRSAAKKQTWNSALAKQQVRRCQKTRLSIKCQAEEQPALGGGLLSALQEVSKSGTQLINQVTGTMKISSSSSSSFGRSRASPKDPNLVFVAGATGRTGSRVVRELLSQGYKVRGGVRSVEKSQDFLKFCKQYELLNRSELSRLEFVEFDLEIPDTIGISIGKASKVACCVGSSESEIDFGQPKRIDGNGTINLIQAAEDAGVKQFILVTSLGTTKFNPLTSLFNLYGGLLIQKARAEKVLQESLMEFTIIRPAGMETPTDKHKETHNLKLSGKDTLFGGTVSRLQIAELIVSCLKNPELAENKILEVVAETEAPKLSNEELLTGIESEELMVDKIARIQEEERIQRETEDVIEKIEQMQLQLESKQEIKGAIESQVREVQSQLQEQQAELADTQQRLKQSQQEVQQAVQQLDDQSKDIEVAEALLTASKIMMGEGRTLNQEEVDDITQKILQPGLQKQQKVEAVAGSSTS
eukprot:TRINITY_DN8107_c0_g1_i3.p1 TRINITY_DN8107_c0_g1~~TRINITY_DN8107_c0_g1_i3.p1  ORF type:complete len:483 (+),score=103.64 TRINITY_DN8107_c0_g1_i3:606-2054(+)